MIKINGKELPPQAIELELRRLFQFHAQHMPPEQVRQHMDELREQAKKQAIGQFLLFEEVRQMDYRVGADEVDRKIAEYESQAGGRAKFDQILQKQGTTRERLRDQVYNGLRLDRHVAKLVEGAPEPTEEEVRQAFEEHRDEFVRPEQVEALHILVTPDGDSPASRREAIDKIRSIRERAVAGDDFGKLAAEHSHCPSGKQAGGSLGKFGRGAMVKEFEDAAFSMEVGEISDIVETQFGFHIIKKVGHEKAVTPAYEQVRDQIFDFLHHAKRGALLSAHVEELMQKARIEETEDPTGAR